MGKYQLILCFQDKRDRRMFYQNDKYYDFVILHKEKIFCLNKRFLGQSQFLDDISNNKNLKFVLLDQQQVDSYVFQQVLKCLYGFDLIIERNWSIIPILDTIFLLKMENIKILIFEDFKNNYDEYGYFILLNIAFRYQIPWLKDKCLNQLIQLDFEQLNFNLNDFVNCPYEIAELIIEFYVSAYIQKKCSKLLSFKNLKKIIRKYKQVNLLDEEQVQNLYELLNPIIDEQSTSSNNSLNTSLDYCNAYRLNGNVDEVQSTTSIEYESKVHSSQDKININIYQVKQNSQNNLGKVRKYSSKSTNVTLQKEGSLRGFMRTSKLNDISDNMSQIKQNKFQGRIEGIKTYESIQLNRVQKFDSFKSSLIIPLGSLKARRFSYNNN